MQGFKAVGVSIKNGTPFLHLFGGVAGVVGWGGGGCRGGGTVGVSIKTYTH